MWQYIGIETSAIKELRNIKKPGALHRNNTKGIMRTIFHIPEAPFCENPSSLKRREPKGTRNDAEGSPDLPKLPRDVFPRVSMQKLLGLWSERQQLMHHLWVTASSGIKDAK